MSAWSQVIKPNARKARKLKEGVVCGFAGDGRRDDALRAARDEAAGLAAFRPPVPSSSRHALSPLSHPRTVVLAVQEHPETMRVCGDGQGVENDKYLRRLEAVMIVCDPTVSLTLTGTGDVIGPKTA